MRSKFSAILPLIDFTSPKFRQEAFGALQKKGGFVLSNMGPTYTSTTRDVFKTFDDFLRRDDKDKAKYRPNNTDVSTIVDGFYDTEIAGRKAGCQKSYFMTRGSNGCLNGPVPPPNRLKISMQPPIDELFLHTQKIIAKTVDAADWGLNLRGELKKVMRNFGMLHIAEQFSPVTQENLKHWMMQGKLTKTENGQIEIFIPHADLHPFTVLNYRTDCAGLEIHCQDEAGNKAFRALELPKDNPYNIYPVVMSGAIIEILTDNLLPALQHRVVTQPLKKGHSMKRGTINGFVNLDVAANPLIEPIKLSPNNRFHAPSEFAATFFKIKCDAHIEHEKRRAVTITPEELAKYPREDEIERIDTPDGAKFRRRA